MSLTPLSISQRLQTPVGLGGLAPTQSESRMGKFRVATDALFKNWEDWLPVFHQIVVVGVDYNQAFGLFAIYTAFHPNFEIVPEGTEIPMYVCNVKKVTDVNDVSHFIVEWTKEKAI